MIQCVLVNINSPGKQSSLLFVVICMNVRGGAEFLNLVHLSSRRLSRNGLRLCKCSLISKAQQKDETLQIFLLESVMSPEQG